MKKEIKIFLVILSLFLLVGCSNKTNNGNNKENDNTKEKATIINCKLENNTNDAYSIKSNYKIYSKNKIVQKVITVETLESEDESILSSVKKQITETYDTASKKYGGYIYDIETKNNQIISTVEIDYEEMNLEEYIKDNPIMKAFTNDNNEISTTGIISIYESLGAKCE